MDRRVILIVTLLVVMACMPPGVVPTATPTVEPSPTTAPPVPSPTPTPSPPTPGPAIAVIGARDDAWLITMEGDPYPSPATDPAILPAPPDGGGLGRAQAVGDTLYYLSGDEVWSVSLSGAVERVYAHTYLAGDVEGFLLSPGRDLLAIYALQPTEGGVAPALAIVPLPEDTPAFVEPVTAATDRSFMPLAWTPDGALLYAHTPWGIGCAYCLFGGFLDIYRWQPGLNQPLFAPTSDYSFCILGLSPDLTLVAHHCETAPPQMKIYNLQTDTEISIGQVADQNVVGAAHFSPSGQWLAYSVARSDPEDEAGSVVVVPSDGSSSPAVIYHTDGGFASVLGWVDEEWLVVQRFTGVGMDVFSSWDLLLMGRDGSPIRLLGSDAEFLGVLQPAE